jgi:hypothetical protein
MIPNDARDAALQYAAQRARRTNSTVWVYVHSSEYFVRTHDEGAPPGAAVFAIASPWDATTIQLRFGGARSEWVKT